MRWPNDVLIGDRKLAGLLVDQFKPGLAVVGIGINVNNQPEACDPGLTRQTIRLADLVEQPPGLTELTALVLRQLRSVLDEANATGFGALLPRVNALWGESRRVTLELDHGKADGQFAGVDESGRLRLVDGREQERLFEAHQVKLLREL
jgi:BirA family biotin operon repressor/biotin-[acetyl-CoA-carboxylase] ligase